MSRPAPHNRSLNSSSTGWVSRLNENFSECLDEPFPMAMYADVTALGTAADARLYSGCRALVGSSGSVVEYTSDGTNWVPARTPLNFIADLDTGTATVADVRTAYNGLLADAQAKGWMV